MENFADMMIEQAIPATIENIKNLLMAIWNEDYPYIIAFLLFIILYIFLNRMLKKKRHY